MRRPRRRHRCRQRCRFRRRNLPCDSGVDPVVVDDAGHVRKAVVADQDHRADRATAERICHRAVVQTSKFIRFARSLLGALRRNCDRLRGIRAGPAPSHRLLGHRRATTTPCSAITGTRPRARPPTSHPAREVGRIAGERTVRRSMRETCARSSVPSCSRRRKRWTSSGSSWRRASGGQPCIASRPSCSTRSASRCSRPT